MKFVRKKLGPNSCAQIFFTVKFHQNNSEKRVFDRRFTLRSIKQKSTFKNQVYIYIPQQS